MIINKLIEYNDRNTFYPAYGICLGFENMIGWAASGKRDQIITNYVSHISQTLDFVIDDLTESTLWAGLG